MAGAVFGEVGGRLLAPRIVNDVSYATDINHVNDGSYVSRINHECCFVVQSSSGVVRCTTL